MTGTFPPGRPSTGTVEAAVRSLFPSGVAVAVTAISEASDADLWPEEAAAVVGAVPKRRAEFRAGRSAARRCLSELGLPPVALPMGADRAPVWPDGIAGSIAHAADIAVAVASRSCILGVDVEADAPLDPELWPVICAAAELARMPIDRRGQLVRQVFAAKEAVFKAQAPATRAMFGFDVVAVTLAEDGFAAQFTRTVGAFRSGQVLPGRLLRIGGLILAGVTR